MTGSVIESHPSPPATWGALVYQQPHREMFLRRAGWMALGLFFGIGFSLLANESRNSVWSFLAASGMAAVFFAFAVVGALMRPFRLWERGVEFRRRFRPTLWRYSDIRDVQLLRNDRGRPTYVRITRVDGTLTTIGSPRVSEADFVSFELERVFGLLDQAVREQGAHAQARWSPEVWASVEPLIFRGSIIARLERAARANGTQLIDTKFVRAATAADPELARWLSLAAVTHAWQEKRKRERPPSRT